VTPTVSSNTKAILLLTAPLAVGKERGDDEILKPAEYRALAARLRELGREPADLVAAGDSDLLDQCASSVDGGRLRRLLSRGFLLSQAIEQWQSSAIWVVSRADSEYPKRWKTRLRDHAPAILFGCGPQSLLDPGGKAGGLAVVGSRNVDAALLEYATSIGRLVAEARRPIISGGARGVDEAVMLGAGAAGGTVIGVLADSLQRTVMKREWRDLIVNGQAVLVSPYDPRARFNVGHAMARNTLIYALADAALIVNAEKDKGGTWAGATEQLRQRTLVQVYVRSTGARSAGLDALRALGAKPWPNPTDAAGLERALAEAPSGPASSNLFGA